MFGKNKSQEGREDNTLENKEDNTMNHAAEDEMSGAADADNTSGDSSGMNDLEKEKQKSAELHDKYLRLYSDFENFRRRTNKEKAELIQYGNRDLLLKILPLFDDMERAMDVASKTDDKAAIMDGMDLIFKKFKSFIDVAGLKVIHSKGEPFDSELHDAITSIPAPSKEMKGKIIDEIQKGYTLNDKVLRHAQVVVGE